MSGLTHIEKQKLEREMGMGSGYVLGFSNRTFEEFFREVVGVEIFNPRFDSGSGSKANRMRAFWRIASDDQLRLLLNGLLDGWSVYANGPMPESARLLLRQVVARLDDLSGDAIPQQKENLASLDHKVSQKLISRLLGVTSANPQQRGYEFEKFLRELFDAYGLSARASFRSRVSR